MPRWLLTTCSIVAIVGCCIVGGGWIVDDPNANEECAGLAFFFGFVPAGCGAIWVAMTVLAVVAFGGWGLAIGAGLTLVLLVTMCMCSYIIECIQA